MSYRIFEAVVFALLTGGLVAFFGSGVVWIWGDADIAGNIAATSVVSVVAGLVFGQGL
jgi:hypothetical protein